MTRTCAARPVVSASESRSRPAASCREVERRARRRGDIRAHVPAREVDAQVDPAEHGGVERQRDRGALLAAGAAARLLLHDEPRRWRRGGLGGREHRVLVEPHRDLLGGDLHDLEVQRLPGLDLRRQLGDERHAGEHDHAVPGDACDDAPALAQRELRQLGAQRQGVEGDPLDHASTSIAPLKAPFGPPTTPGHMDRGLYIAASGMLAEQIRQDQIANDLANAATPGYKSDRTAQREFGELLLTNRANGAAIGG